MTQVVVSLQDFLRTGEFGPVCLGVSRDRLRGLLGAPENWGPHPSGQRLATIWKYGDIEFHFSGDTLWLIIADDVETLDGSTAFKLDPWILNGEATVETVLTGLEEAHIPCQRIERTIDDATERFRVGAGIELLFRDKTQYLLDSDGISPLARPGTTFDGFSYSVKD